MSKELFVPGRLCLFGEHSDWAGGYRRMDESITPGHCMAIGTDQGIYATVSPHPDKIIIRSASMKGEAIGSQEFQMGEVQLLRAAQDGGFFSYCAGVASYVLEEHEVGGLVIDNRMNLPIGKGLSSSASICVLTARAFSQVYDLGLTRRQEMEYAYQGEILTASECGRMDQVCAYGETPVFLTFDGDKMEIEEIFPQQPVYMVIADLQKGKNTKKILADLNHHFIEEDGPIKEGLRYALGDANREILTKAKQLLRAGDSANLGELMNEAQRLFDECVCPACPEELTAPKLHEILSHPDIQDLIWGGKGVGSQGDGCVQFIAKGLAEQEELIKKLWDLDVRPYNLIIKAFTPHKEL
ncbi:mevalonate kinase [Candidatus Poribacteria bacterium]